MTDSIAQRPIDRILELAVAKGFAKDGKANIRALARAAEIDHSQLIRARDSDTGRLRQDAMEALAKALDTTIGALLGETAEAVQAQPSGTILVDAEQIALSDLNPRKTIAAGPILDLADSIAANGLLQNLVVRPCGERDDGRPAYVIVAGERRFRAIRHLRAQGRWPADQGIPVKVIDGDEAEHLALALLENLQRLDVNPMEEAEAFAKLIALDTERWSPATIAAKIGCSVRHIQQRLALVSRLDPMAQAAVKSGLVSATQARALTMATPERQKDLVRNIQKFPTADAIRNEITASMVPVTRAIFALDSYAGRIAVNDQTGTKYFADKAEFMAAQRNAAQALTEELAGQWAWTEFHEAYYPPLYNYRKGTQSEEKGNPARIIYAVEDDDRTKAGAIVHYAVWDAKVTVYQGLVKAEEAKEDPEEEARLRAEAEARQAEQAARLETMHAFSTSMKQALRDDPNGAIALLALYPTLTYAHGTVIDLDAVAGIGKDSINGGNYSFLASFVAPANERGIHVLKDDADLAAAWKSAMAHREKTLRALAGFIGSGLHLARGGALHPLVIAMADHYGVTVPEGCRPPPHPGQIDLEEAINDENRRKGRIIALLEPVREAHDETPAETESDIRALLAGGVNLLNRAPQGKPCPGGLMLGPDTMGGATVEELIDETFGIFADSAEYQDISTLDDAVRFVCQTLRIPLDEEDAA